MRRSAPRARRAARRNRLGTDALDRALGETGKRNGARTTRGWRGCVRDDVCAETRALRSARAGEVAENHGRGRAQGVSQVGEIEPPGQGVGRRRGEGGGEDAIPRDWTRV